MSRGRRGVGRALLVAATLIVVATLAAALWVMDSPSKQRDRRIDEARVEELGAIARAIDEWAGEKGRMPASLAELAGQPGSSLGIVDPVDGEPYGYEVGPAPSYRLCATFATSTSDRRRAANRYQRYNDAWMHPAGRHCFDRKLGPEATAAMPAAAEKP
ncbi:MAG: hypothetical protein EOP93_09695 [Lysobacteraceae bacterium]|nr:MAG: hypothetical protein EOP93_09695 [Xanthomonadaceae bacterium]